MSGLGIGEGGHHPCHCFSLLDKEGSDPLMSGLCLAGDLDLWGISCTHQLQRMVSTQI